MITILVQARLGSTRLPCKVLYPVKGKPLIRYMYERLLLCRNVTKIQFIVPQKDEKAIAHAGVPAVSFPTYDNGIRYEEDEDNVLARFKRARVSKGYFIRLCADSPLIDPEVVNIFTDRIMASFKDAKRMLPAVGPFHIMTNTKPRTWPAGQCVEAMSAALWSKYAGPFSKSRNARPLTRHDQEHVMPWYYDTFPEMVENIGNPIGDFSNHSMTLDTPDDYRKIARIIESMEEDHTKYGWRECLFLAREDYPSKFKAELCRELMS